MFNIIFPMVTSWVNSNLIDERKAKYFEYLYNLNYHLNHAKNSKNTCSSAIFNFEIGFFTNGKFLIKIAHPGEILYSGDTAIREAVSALDTSLILINHILNLELPQNKIKWTEPGKSILRKKILGLKKQGSIELVSAIDSIFNSIGYKLLQGYRNWVTHRGAPILEIPEGLSDTVAVPKEILEEVNIKKRHWAAKSYLTDLVLKQITIKCWPFIPPAFDVVNAEVKNEAEDKQIHGIHIGKGSHVIIKDMRVHAGNISDDASLFESNNRILLEKSLTIYAGENLAIYTAMDYIQGINLVTHFVEKSFSSELDEILVGWVSEA